MSDPVAVALQVIRFAEDYADAVIAARARKARGVIDNGQYRQVLRDQEDKIFSYFVGRLPVRKLKRPLE